MYWEVGRVFNTKNLPTIKTVWGIQEKHRQEPSTGVLEPPFGESYKGVVVRRITYRTSVFIIILFWYVAAFAIICQLHMFYEQMNKAHLLTKACFFLWILQNYYYI